MSDSESTSVHRTGVPAAGFDALTALEEVARRRRSSLRVDVDRPVPAELVERLISLAVTAPNHHRTTPWRFRVLTGAGRDRLGHALAEELARSDDSDSRIEKARSKYRRTPVIVVVASRAGVDGIETAENRDAVSAAIQTLLLGATAAGLVTLWSTGMAARSDLVRDAMELDPTDTVVGVLYLGWPLEPMSATERPAPETRWIDA